MNRWCTVTINRLCNVSKCMYILYNVCNVVTSNVYSFSHILIQTNTYVQIVYRGIILLFEIHFSPAHIISTLINFKKSLIRRKYILYYFIKNVSQVAKNIVKIMCIYKLQLIVNLIIWRNQYNSFILKINANKIGIE